MFLDRPYQKKPSSPQLNRGHPINAGIAFCCYPVHSLKHSPGMDFTQTNPLFIDLVSGKRAVQSSDEGRTLAINHTVYGYSPSRGDTAGIKQLGRWINHQPVITSKPSSGDGDLTLLFCGAPYYIASNRCCITIEDKAGSKNLGLWQGYIADTGTSNTAGAFSVSAWDGATERGTGAAGIVPSGNTTAKDRHNWTWMMGAVTRRGTTYTVYRNGGIVVNTRTTATFNVVGSGSVGGIAISGYTNTADFAMDGPWSFGLAWNRALSPAELYDIWETPFLPLMPYRNRIFSIPDSVAAAGGNRRRRMFICGSAA